MTERRAKSLVANAINEYIPQLPGWSDPYKCIQMAHAIMDLKPDISFEIGMYGGRGLLSMAFAHRQINHGRAISIDPWEVEPTQEGENIPENDKWWKDLGDSGYFDKLEKQWYETVIAHNIYRFVDNWKLKSDQAIHIFDNESIGFIHQDGNHSEQVSFSEVDQWQHKLQRGGYWMFDDYSWPTTQKARNHIEETLKWEIVAKCEQWCLYRKP